MHYKKLIALSLSAIILFSTTAYSMDLKDNQGEIKAVPISVQLPKQDGTNVVVAKEIKSESRLVKYNVSIPKVEGLKDIVYQEQLNNILMSQGMKDIKNVEAQAEALWEMAEKEGRTFKPFEIFINYEVKSNGNILSFIINTYSYTGGANGITRMDCYNIDTKQNENVDLEGLFKADTDYKAAINNEIKSQIAVRKEIDKLPYFDGNMGFKSIADSQAFFIENNNLVIVFQKYAIAPGYMGTPEFRIPLASLNSVLRNLEPAIVEGIYYNYKYNFKFKIPPLWKDKVKVTEEYDKEGSNLITTFIYLPQGDLANSSELASISVVSEENFKKEENKDKYKIAETDAYIYLVSLSKSSPYTAGSETEKEYKQFIAALDGVDDLFKLANVKQLLDISAGNTVYDKILANGKEITLQNAIYKTGKGIAMLPLRQIAEALGYTVDWNDEKQLAELSKGAQWTVVKPNDDNYSFAKMLIKLGTAPEIVKDRTYVPVEFFSKILKAEVILSDNGTITIVQK